MISTRSASALIGIASCVASFLAGIAYADGFVPAPAREPTLSVVACGDDEWAPTRGQDELEGDLGRCERTVGVSFE
jgi:hypothetical protein